MKNKRKILSILMFIILGAVLVLQRVTGIEIGTEGFVNKNQDLGKLWYTDDNGVTHHLDAGQLQLGVTDNGNWLYAAPAFCNAEGAPAAYNVVYQGSYDVSEEDAYWYYRFKNDESQPAFSAYNFSQQAKLQHYIWGARNFTRESAPYLEVSDKNVEKEEAGRRPPRFQRRGG